MSAIRGTGPDAGLPVDASPRFSPDFPDTCSDAGIQPAPHDVVAFVGRTLKGPVDHPVGIDDFSRFQQLFGGLWSGSLLPHAVEQFFEHGGRRAVVVRVAAGARAPSIDLTAGRERLTLAGISPGSGEALRASVDYDGIGRHDLDLFNLVVQRVRTRGSELVEEQEIFRRVSILPGSAREVTRKLAASNLLRVAGPLPSVRPDITRGRDPAALIGYAECNGDGEDGALLSDYDLIGSEARRSGLFALQGGPAFNFLYMPPPARERDVGISALVVGARFCRAHHALLLVDPPLHWRRTTHALDGLMDWPFHSADALMFFPRLSAPDRLSGRDEEFPPAAAAIGTLLRNDHAGSWMQQSPALLRPTATPLVWVDQQQRARLAQLGVNALRATRTPLRDAIEPCTLAGELGNGPAARLLSERRLALHLSASIERGTRWVALEGNTPRSRERACRQVEHLLAGFAAHGAFAGELRNQDWFVLCDARLNAAEQVQAGTFRLVWGYRPARGTSRHAWLVEHCAAGSHSRAVSLNQLAALG